MPDSITRIINIFSNRGYPWGYNTRGGRRYGGLSPASGNDWERELGTEISDAELVRICLYWIIRYIALAPLSLKRRADDKAMEAVPAHPMLDLLMTPNEEYDFATMLQGNA